MATGSLFTHGCDFLNLVQGFVVMGLFLYYLSIRSKNVRIFPVALRRYLYLTCVPYAFIITIGSITLGMYYTITKDTSAMFYVICRFIMIIASQQIRGSFFGIVCERIIATIYLEKYKKYCSLNLIVAAMTLTTYCINGIYFYIAVNWIFFSSTLVLYHCATYVALGLHIVTLVVCKILEIKNKQMYRLLAYRVTLKRRSTILENIKTLKLVWPIVWRFSLIAPIGPITTVTFNFISGTPAPVALFHASYIFFFILVLIELISKSRKRQVSVIPMKAEFVASPLGRELPKNQTIDDYFSDLKRQWK